MIVKQQKGQKNRSITRSLLKFSGAILLFVLLFAGFSYFRLMPVKSEFKGKELSCNLENIQLIDGKEKIISNGYLFEGIETRSNQLARSGVYSSRLTEDQIYGIGHNFTDAKPGDRFHVSVWRKGPKLAYSYLTVSISGNEGQQLYRQEEVATEVDENDWEKIEMIFEVPSWYAGQEIKTYAYLASKGVEVFFDDYSIKKLDKTVARNDLIFADSSFQKLEIRVEEKGLKKLEAKRQEAIHRGILFSSDNDWVKALLNSPEELSAKIRLKGDWMDHLKGDKWSFRIKVKTPQAWNRMVTFSVQNPETRNFLSEWVYHYLLEQEDILTPRFDFIHLIFNHKPWGIYAYEEHFEKQIAEYKSRREGPIVKFSEEGVWNARKRSLDFRENGFGTEEHLKTFETARVEPFKQAKTFSSPTLSKQFEIAQTLMNQYRFGEKSASEIFDIEKLATYYAIIDLTKGYHSLVWHNQRFYYNPVTTKLEPIGFDGFTEKGLFSFSDQPFLGGLIPPEDELGGQNLIYRPFYDSVFVRHYVEALDRITQKSFLDNLQLNIESEIQKREEFLRQDFPNYSYQSPLKKNAAEIRRVLFPLESALRAHQLYKKDGVQQIRLTNNHILPIEVFGYGNRQNDLKSFEKSVWLNSNPERQIPINKDLSIPNNAKILWFRMPGSDQTYQTSITSWAVEKVIIPTQELFENIQLSSNSLYQINGREIQFERGKFQIDQDLIFPEGYKIQIAGGTQIDFIKGAKFISKSAIHLLGEPENPIKIFSSDHTAGGFTILQAKEKSSVRYTVFEDFNTLEDRGWTLTGAVTFYESNVDIDHSSFIRSHCEDGLNIIRSDFTLSNSLVAESAFDGFDADFCKGKVINTRFFKPGNDGMDFSGSLITIIDSEVEAAADKGLSIGEEATVTVESLKIYDCNNGLVAKDLSKVTVHEIVLENCRVGFSAYQKKPEFGGARIEVGHYQDHNVKILHLIENGSILKLNGKEIGGV